LTLEPDSIGAWVALYAAIVSTGALFLEVRRWFESGPRLNITYMLDAITFPRDRENKSYIAITAANRGDAATTITNLGFQAYPSRWARFRGKASDSFIANNPSQAQPIPHFIEPGGRWIGMCIQNDEIIQLLDTGLLWAEVYATHTDKPTSVRIKRRTQPKGEKVEGSGG
jgi:hypothetical protein